MKYPKVIYLFLSVSLFQNCNQKEPFEASNALHTIEIKKDFLLNQVNELKFKATDTIDLERPGNPPLTTIQDVVFSTESIFLLDRKHGLLKYDDAGNFLQSIGKKGEGPDEYLMPTAIYLNEVENVALIADWEKMVVTSYDLEGNFIASSGKIPGRPISFYKEGDNLLMILEGIESYGEGSQTVLVSSINPTTLDLTSEVTTLYGFSSKFYRIHQYLRPFGEINDTLLFYLPRVRLAGLADHMDTIYRMEVGHLLPEYQLDFTDFPKSDTIQIDLIE
ncbi:MAG: 6-bladed beta-propeller, partial [Algoriphagus sp.]